MKNYIHKTIIVAGPKRAGKTLLLRLFDNEKDVIHFLDEAFFWEHVFNFQEQGNEALFVDMFRHFSPEKLNNAFMERDILPCLSGVFRQYNPIGAVENFKVVETSFNSSLFVEHLTELQQCESVSDIWNVLCHAYSVASGTDSLGCRTAFMMSGDPGKSMIASKQCLDDCRSVFIVRDPYLAMDSLKMSRRLRGDKILNVINFSQVLTYYRFIMQNKDRIFHGSTFLIRYEDLIAKPQESMSAIAMHCGVEYSSNLVTPTLLGNLWGTNSIVADEVGIDVSAIKRELKALDSDEVAFISCHLADFIEYFGYEMRG